MYEDGICPKRGLGGGDDSCGLCEQPDSDTHTENGARTREGLPCHQHQHHEVTVSLYAVK